MEKITLTRKKLYDLVWSTPMTTIAKKYLISDVGLRKICIAMDIPLPRAGHWEKIKAGKAVDIPPLSQSFSDKKEITLQLRSEKDPPPTQKDPVRALVKELKDQTKPFKVPTVLTSKDPMILKAQKALTEPKRYMHRGLTSGGRGNLAIEVSPENVNRALCFIQGLISALEQRGHQLQVRSEETVVVVSGQSMRIALREKLKVRKTPNNWGSYSNDYEPEGSLILKLGQYGTKEWQDGSKKLEDQLPEIIARMEVEAKRSIEAEMQRKKEHDKWVEEEKQRKAVEQKRKQEADNFRRFVTNAQHWQVAKHLRSYVEELEKHFTNTNALTEELKEWLEWAKQKVDWYDPLINAKDPWLTDEDRNRVFVQEKNLGYSFFTQGPESSSYFQRPWYT